MEALTIHPQNSEQLKAIKSVLRAMKIPFEKKDSFYDPEFVKMIQEAEKDRENSTVLKTDEDIKKFFEEL
jgi:antitoxin component of RelBE/YafQ-DinJ toxin-antitoxin module